MIAIVLVTKIRPRLPSSYFQVALPGPPGRKFLTATANLIHFYIYLFIELLLSRRRSLDTKGNLPSAKLAMLARRNAYSKLTEFMQSTEIRVWNLSTNKVENTVEARSLGHQCKQFFRSSGVSLGYRQLTPPALTWRN